LYKVRRTVAAGSPVWLFHFRAGWRIAHVPDVARLSDDVVGNTDLAHELDCHHALVALTDLPAQAGHHFERTAERHLD
jgi:hypothetical protein